MKVAVVSRSGREIVKGGLDLPDEATVADLQHAIYKYNRKWQPVRQRLTLAPAAPSSSSSGGGSGASGAKPTVLDSRKRLSDYSSSLAGGDGTLTVVFKDLGPQIGYSTVFFWEYFGPLAIYPLFYFFPGNVYPQSTLDAAGATPTASADAAATAAGAAGTVRALALAFWSAHYAKRILETFFVHRFSHGTMPLFNLFRNCAYYWLFAAYVSYFVNHPLYTPVSLSQAYVGFGIGVAAEMGNFICHIILRNLRPPNAAAKGGGDASSYVIPRGFLFDYVTCPNYMCEIVAWLGFNIATQTVAGYLFMAAGAYQMTMWALQKHKRLRRLFDGKEGREKYPRRWVVFPPLL